MRELIQVNDNEQKEIKLLCRRLAEQCPALPYENRYTTERVITSN